MCDKCNQCKHTFEPNEGVEAVNIVVFGTYLWDGFEVDGVNCFPNDDIWINRVVEVICYNGPDTVWYQYWGDSWDIREFGKQKQYTVQKKNLKEIRGKV